jgi:hypothetical protein
MLCGYDRPDCYDGKKYKTHIPYECRDAAKVFFRATYGYNVS